MKDILENLNKEAQSAGEIHKQFNPGAAAEPLLSIYDGIILHEIFVGQRNNMELMRKTTMSLIAQGRLICKSR